LMLRVWPQ